MSGWKRPAWRRILGRPALWVGMLLGSGATIGAMELSYVNWRASVAPIDARSLLIRHDAKGDGRFAAPRSGHRRHRGVDLVAELHSPVRTIRSGSVVQVGFHRGLGRFVEVEHRGGLRSLYAHLDEITVEPGERLRQGAVIGTVGKTGNARHPWITPHLHLEVIAGGEPINPETLGLRIVDASAGDNEQGQQQAADDEGLDAEARGGE